MLTLPSTVKIWVSSSAIDMRKGAYSLATVVQQELQLNSKDGHLFVFFGRRYDRVKILYWDRNGFALWYKILSKGKFRPPQIKDKRYCISTSDLNILLEGIDLTNNQRLKAI